MNGGRVTRWAALLRGVNVGGVTVRSADLAALFRELGFADVSTILATGNVVFTTDGDATDGAATAALPQLKSRIEAGLRDRFGYDAWIVLVPHADLARICTGYAFERDDEVVHPYVIFGSDEAVLDDFFASATALSTGSTGSTGATGSAGSTADVARAPGVVYWRVERGSTTDSPVGKLLSRARYAASTTTRNLRTVEKIVAR